MVFVLSASQWLIVRTATKLCALLMLGVLEFVMALLLVCKCTSVVFDLRLECHGFNPQSEHSKLLTLSANS